MDSFPREACRSSIALAIFPGMTTCLLCSHKLPRARLEGVVLNSRLLEGNIESRPIPAPHKASAGKVLLLLRAWWLLPLLLAFIDDSHLSSLLKEAWSRSIALASLPRPASERPNDLLLGKEILEGEPDLLQSSLSVVPAACTAAAEAAFLAASSTAFSAGVSSLYVSVSGISSLFMSPSPTLATELARGDAGGTSLPDSLHTEQHQY